MKFKTEDFNYRNHRNIYNVLIPLIFGQRCNIESDKTGLENLSRYLRG